MRIILAALMLLTFPVLGANWYVDKDATGTASGTGWTDAFTSVADIAWASVQSGDTIYISGGPAAGSKVYANQWLTATKSGTSNAPITICLEAGNASHNGTAIFDYSANGDAATGRGLSLMSHYVIDGNVNGEQHLQFRNMVNSTNRTISMAIGISSEQTNITIRYCLFTNVGNPIRLPYIWNASVHNCSFQGVRNDAAIHAGTIGEAWDQSFFYNNDIQMLVNGGGPDGMQVASGATIYSNVFRVSATALSTSGQHPDMVQASGNYLKCFNNEFRDIGDSGIDFTAWVAGEGKHHALIFNNLFRNATTIGAYPEFIRLYNNEGLGYISEVKVINNTFVDSTNGNTSFVRFATSQGNPLGTNNEVKNNIFYNVGAGNSYALSIGGPDAWTFGGNLFYHPQGLAQISYTGTVRTASAWVISVETTGTTNAPQFAQYSPFAESNDLRLSGGDTAAKNGGIDLSALGVTELMTDRIGVARDSVWDIGAYEYVPPPSSSTVKGRGGWRGKIRVK